MSENRVFERSDFGLRQQFVRGFIDPETYHAALAERNAAWSSLSPTDQLAILDRRLGVGIGAKRQRPKLTAQRAALANIGKSADTAVTTEQFASKAEERRVKALRKQAKHANRD